MERMISYMVSYNGECSINDSKSNPFIQQNIAEIHANFSGIRRAKRWRKQFKVRTARGGVYSNNDIDIYLELDICSI